MKTHLQEAITSLKAAHQHVAAAREDQPQFVVDLLNHMTIQLQGSLNYLELLVGVLTPKESRGPSKRPKQRRQQKR